MSSRTQIPTQAIRLLLDYAAKMRAASPDSRQTKPDEAKKADSKTNNHQPKEFTQHVIK